VIFDEATPEAVLDALRPDVFAKGGDYEDADLPEAALMRSWGGQAVLVPYLPGHSTSSIVEEVRLRAV
jgi:D-beta-D-heptose 7-phosphate kinase / D-beta-D-heptose 1-phosphate adenosyltransferase